MDIQKKRSIGISLVRSVACLMIVVCHLGTAYGYSSIGQFFQSGVQIFLLISGVLYGNKDIGAPGKWLLNRWKKISIPCYLHAAFVSAVSIIVGFHFSPIGLVEILLNVEGYHHILAIIPNPWVVIGTAHFWFVTAIFLCYGMVAFIKTKIRSDFIQRNALSVLTSILIVSVLLGLIGIRLDYVFIFMLGYTLGALKLERVSNKQMLISLIAFVSAIALRLIGKKYCDIHGDNSLYLYVIIPLAYNAIAFALYTFIMRISESIEKNNKILVALRGPINRFDSLSFYIFITHYMLIDGPISITHISPVTCINVILILLGTLVASIALKLLTESLFKLGTKQEKEA